MSDKVLLVDDEPNVLAGYERQLRKSFTVDTAGGGEQGLAALASRGPYAVIVSDMRMPGLNGSQFLARARQEAPESVRMLLTGYADFQSAIAAVNEGHVFRFLTKPCPAEQLIQALEAGVAQYRLIRSEKELLEKTLHGSIQVLTEVMALVSPLAFGKATRVRRLARELGTILHVKDLWQLEVAAMLSQLGCVTVPDAILGKLYAGANLVEKEREMFEACPQIGRDLLRKIPRMEEIADIIAAQTIGFFGQGHPGNNQATQDIPLEARILRVALDCDNLEARGYSRPKVLEWMSAHAHQYDPAVLAALAGVPELLEKYTPRRLGIPELRCQMVLAEDVTNGTGLLLVRKGMEITDPLLHRLHNFFRNGAIRDAVDVLVPPASS